MPESPFAEDVGERLPPRAPLDQLVQAVRHFALAFDVELRPGDAEHVRDEQLRVDVRRVDAGRAEALLRESKRFCDRHSPSARLRSSAPSASVKSSSSPCKTRSS